MFNFLKHFKDKAVHSRTSEDIYDKSYANVNSEASNMYMFYPFNETHPYKRLHFSKNHLFTIYSYVLMEKGCLYKKNMTEFVERIHSKGFPEYFIWMRLPLEAKDFGKRLPPPNETPLTIESTALCFLILAFGLVVSMAAFGLEKMMPDNKWISPRFQTGEPVQSQVNAWT